jgi:sorbitol-specific phosphotransferase system component IIC
MGQVFRGPGAGVDPHLLPLEVVILSLAELAGHDRVTRLLEGAASCEDRAWLVKLRQGH